MSKSNREIGDKEPVPSDTKRVKAAKSDSTELTHNDYAVGWICALPKERAAAMAILDQRHRDLPKPEGDKNAYTLGSIGKHNVVVACLPKGRYGTNSAAIVATQMVHAFPSIKLGLMVGIGGGIPPKVRLGDVVISTPGDQFPGVVQWDMGKAKEGGEFKRTGALNNPPDAFLTALTAMEAEHDMTGSKVPEYLDELKQKWPKMAKQYLKSGSLKDILFRADYSHISGISTEHYADPEINDGEEDGAENRAGDETEDETENEEEQSCRFCDKTKIVKRSPRRKMRVHYGLIASGNQVIKDATFRDKLNEDLGGNILCIEMEAAGLTITFPCIVIRGICDYADSHKNKAWQKHAAAVAAAVAKELLGHVQPSDVDRERTVKDILDETKQRIEDVHQQVVDGFVGAKAGLDNLLGEQELQKKNLILDWLYPIDFTTQQNDYITRRELGTAEWLLNTTEFQSWLKTGKQTLFCPGLPGAGKTIQTAAVIHDLCNRFRNDRTIGIAYLYCNFQKQRDQRTEFLLANLLKQLAGCQNTLPDSVAELYNQHQVRKTRPLLKEISTTLQSVTITYSRVFIVVDALDECQDSDGSRTSLLNELFSLQNKSEISLFATSRFIPEIMERFQDCLSLDIRPSQEDILRYLDRHMSALPGFVKSDKDLQTEVKTNIEAAIDGVFLLAKLYLDSLVGKRSQAALRKALKSLRKATQRPHGQSRALYDAYEKAMERIRLQQGDLPRDATLILSWIVNANRQLTVPELQHALAVEADTDKLDESNIPTVEHITQACAPLVTIDKESNIIRLVHYTLQEFFEKERSVWLPNAQADITRISITYLSFKAFDSGHCQIDTEFERRLESYKLYDYAAHNWGHHAREASTSCQKVVDFLQSELKTEAASQALLAVKPWYGHSNYSQEVPRQMTGLHLAAYFGVKEAMIALLENIHNLNSKDSYHRTPLSYAAQMGYEAVVELLLEKGAELETKDKYNNWTPLSWAAGKGHETVVELLLEKGAELETKDKSGQTPLSYAARIGHEAVVELLLEKNAELETKDKYNNWTPLLWAVGKGHEAVVELLLEKGAELETKDKFGRTPLSWAAGEGHKAVVELLLEKGVELETKDESGRTPLSYAAQMGYEAVVELLLEKGAELETKDKSGQTPLSWAARIGLNLRRRNPN